MGPPGGRARGLRLDTIGYRIDGMSIPAWATDIQVEYSQQNQWRKGLPGFMAGFFRNPAHAPYC